MQKIIEEKQEENENLKQIEDYINRVSIPATIREEIKGLDEALAVIEELEIEVAITENVKKPAA